MVEDAEDADFESFVRRMADDGEWGDAVTLQAAADVYGVVVCLVTSYEAVSYTHLTLPTILLV